MAELKVYWLNEKKTHKDGSLDATGNIVPFIENPVMKGAVPDYKATSLAVAELLLREQVRTKTLAERMQKWIDSYDRLARETRTEHDLVVDTKGIAHKYRGHWSLWFLPTELRNIISDYLTL
jgi:hypothetical protein